MSNFMAVHTGTGTYFAIDRDAYVIDTSKLTDEEFDQLQEDDDVEAIVEKYGFQLSDDFLRKAIDDVNA